MKFMLRFFLKGLAKSNKWYDNLDEPIRFIVSVIYGLFPFMFLAGLGAAAGSGVFYVLGLIWVLISVVAMRAWWLYGNLQLYLEDEIDDDLGF